MGEMISVVIVDDHAMVRAGIRSYLGTQPDIDIVGEAENGEEAIKVARIQTPDVVLMDLIMPGLDGIEATHRIRAVSSHTQVIVLTSFHDDTNIFPAIRAGALSYLLKDAGPEEIADAVRCAARGESVLHPQVAARLVQSVQSGLERPINPYVDLTEREQEVLRLVADGLTNAQIATALGIGEKTVKGHVSNLLGKLSLEDRTQAAVFAWREGFARRRVAE
jgi:NarL family two-component system response regulator LiaR